MMRGVGNSQFNLILGHMVDVLAEKLGMDPIDLASRTSATSGRRCPTRAWRRCCTRARERIGWKEKRHAPGAGPTSTA